MQLYVGGEGGEGEKAGKSVPIEDLLKQPCCFAMVGDALQAIAHRNQTWAG